MKNYILVLIFFITKLTYSQYPVLSTTSLANESERDKSMKHGNYAIDTANERNQYAGLWRYEQNHPLFSILFEIKIELVDQHLNIFQYDNQFYYSYIDQIVIRYKLIKNGLVIYDNLNDTSVDSYVNYGIKDGSSSYLGGRILDFTKNVVGSYTIKRLDTIPPKIIFNLGEFNYSRKNPDWFYQNSDPLFSIPVGDIEMVKVD